jgi:hypothetical protein
MVGVRAQAGDDLAHHGVGKFLGKRAERGAQRSAVGFEVGVRRVNDVVNADGFRPAAASCVRRVRHRLKRSQQVGRLRTGDAPSSPPQPCGIAASNPNFARSLSISLDLFVTGLDHG